MTDGRFDIARCRRESTLTYLGKEICSEHWAQLADNRSELRLRLNIKEKEGKESDD